MFLLCLNLHGQGKHWLVLLRVRAQDGHQVPVHRKVKGRADTAALVRTAVWIAMVIEGGVLDLLEKHGWKHNVLQNFSKRSASLCTLFNTVCREIIILHENNVLSKVTRINTKHAYTATPQHSDSINHATYVAPTV